LNCTQKIDNFFFSLVYDVILKGYRIVNAQFVNCKLHFQYHGDDFIFFKEIIYFNNKVSVRNL